MLNTIKHKATGDLVKVAQYLTKYAELGKASGTYDANFVSYVISWQRSNKLTADGIIGPKSWAKIAENAPLCTTSRNRKSRYTCALQLLLGIEADGIYGPKTKAAVAAFQAASGLETDGKCGAKTWAALIVGAAVAAPDAPVAGKFRQPVDYKQGDSRWGSKLYTATGSKKQTMASSACGPTAAADVVATLKDASVTPYTLAQLYVANGFRTKNSGTAWAAFKWTAERYGFSKFIQTTSLNALKACLDAGGYVVCSMGPGYWTKNGHFICAWKYEGGYIYANDPASKVRKRQKQADFVAQRKQYFCFYP